MVILWSDIPTWEWHSLLYVHMYLLVIVTPMSTFLHLMDACMSKEVRKPNVCARKQTTKIIIKAADVDVEQKFSNNCCKSA